MARTSKTPGTQTTVAPVIKILTQDDLVVLTQAFHDQLDLIVAQQREILDRLTAPAPARHRRQSLKPTRP